MDLHGRRGSSLITADDRRRSAVERRGGGGRGQAGSDALWDADAAARYLSVSRSMVYKLEQAGELACVRIGACIRFEPAAVRAFARGEHSAPVSATSPRGQVPRR